MVRLARRKKVFVCSNFNNFPFHVYIPLQTSPAVDLSSGALFMAGNALRSAGLLAKKTGRGLGGYHAGPEGIYGVNGGKDRDQRTEIRGQRSEIRDQRSEVRGQRSEVRCQKSEASGRRKTEIRGQRSEIRDQKSEDR